MKKWKIISLLLGVTMLLSTFLTACGQRVEPPELPPEAAVETQGVPLGMFEIITPELNSTNVGVNPRVAWTAEENAEKYLIHISERTTFEQIFAEETTTRTYTAISKTLHYSTKYYLRIYAMKNDETGKEIALSYRSTVFKTQAYHETPVPDNSKTRTIHDFENFEDDYDLQTKFKTHTGGDPLIPTLAVGEGVNGSNAMKLSFSKAGTGWSSVTSVNDADKKNWSGATGIRLWINSDGNGGKFTIQIGKRGYQRWAAAMVLNSKKPCYVSVPFSEFEDRGGGDGVWDITGIVHLNFYFHPISSTQSATILIDEVTIGSDDLHSTDTRANVEKPPLKEIVVDTPFETFESVADGANWEFTHDPDNKDITKSVQGSNLGLHIYDGTSFGTNSYTLTATGYDFEDSDLTTANGFRMAVTSIIVSGVGSYSGPQMLCTVTVGSAGNYYTMTKEIFNYSNSFNQIPYIVCDFNAMTLADGSEGTLDKSKIDTLKITVSGLNEEITSHQMRFDDMEFYSAEVGAMGVSFVSDFTDETTQDWGTAVIANGIATRSVTSGSGFSLTYKTASSAWPNYQNSYAIRFRVKTTNVSGISVRLYNDALAGKGLKSATEIVMENDGQYHDYIVYFDNMIEAKDTPHVSLKFQMIEFYATCEDGSGGTIECEKVELLIG